MANRLAGKTVLITGASSGIGLSLARAFADQGCNLALGARRTERFENIKAELKNISAAGKIWTSKLDVTQTDDVNSFVDQAYTRFGQVDVLLNNAGLALGIDPIAGGNIEDWSRVMDTNVMGVLRVSRAILPRMAAQANGGHVINIGSIAGFYVYEGGGVYCASKHALRAITQTLRLEMNGKPIRVSSIDPGMVETEFSQIRFRGDEQKASQVYQGMTPLLPDDIAESVVFIANRPAHVNIDQLVITPLDQAGLKVARRT